MKRYKFCILFTLLACAALLSCHDDSIDEPQPANREWNVAWSEGQTAAEIDIFGRYYSLYTTMMGTADSTLLLSTTADWLTLASPTLPADGIIQVLAKANEGTGRTADIVVSSAKDPALQVVLTLRQRGLDDDRINADDSDPISDYRVGWGFNAFDEYKSLNSLRGKIIDASRLERFDSETTFNCLQEVIRSMESFNVISAFSQQEMSLKLTREMTVQMDVLFAKKTVRRFSEVCRSSVKEAACSYARLQKTVAQRSIDEGALRYLTEEEPMDDLPFTNAFRDAYKRVVNSQGSQREAAIGRLIDDYGTHLIISASVGCKMDLCLTFDKSMSYDYTKEARETSSKVFGRSKKESSEKVSEHLTSNLSNSNSVHVSGGSLATRTRLETAIKTLTDNNVLEGDLVLNWLGSISANDLNEPSRRKNLDVVDFRFMPIWDIFPDVGVQGDIMKYVLEMSKRSDCGFTDRELGLDNYHFDLRSGTLADFSTGQNASLVRVARFNGVPLIEICEEYVPAIRSDRRIVVYYPILEGRTHIGQGVFVGDGDNPPAVLTFSDGEIYVDPINGYGTGDIIKDLYYVHGNLYTQDLGIGMQEVTQPEMSNEVFRVSNITTPIVKIGSGYWARRNVHEHLDFGVESNGRFMTHEVIINDMLYADIFKDNSPDFQKKYPGLFDNEKDSQTGKAIHWYVPSVSDVLMLKKYIGNNTKALFMGQPSAFDAQFAGYYGYYDDFYTIFGVPGLRYRGECCFIAAKDNSTSGTVLVLKPDYTLTEFNIQALRPNYYPVRPFRTSDYRYK